MEEEYVMFSGLNSLDFIGLHPFKHSFRNHLKAFVFIIFTLICYSLNLAGVVFKYEGIRSLADSIDAIPAGQQVTVKLLSVLLLRKKMRYLYNMVEKKWPNDIYGENLVSRISELSNSFKKIYNMYRGTIWFTAVLYVSKPLILFSKTAVTEMYVPCDFTDNFCYFPVVGLEAIYIADLAYLVYIFDAVFYAFLFHAYCELEKIKYGFAQLNIAEDNTDIDNENTYKEFCKIVKHHTFIINFLKEVNGVYYLQLLNHFIAITATIVFGIFFMNMDGFPPGLGQVSRYVPYLMSYHFQLYIYCITGEEVYNQVRNVADVMYQTKWYEKYNLKLNKGILMVMNVSRIENKLTIGGLWKVNLSTFMSVIKTSMSFHAFMQTVYKSGSK